MDLNKTGGMIATLRKEKQLTQKEVAEKIGVCAKTVSKWETGRGFPDVTLISALTEVLGVDAQKLLEGELPNNKKSGGNVGRTKFYLCKNCGNVLTSIGNSEISCCGRKLVPLVAKASNAAHRIDVNKIEDEYYVTFFHPMQKDHYISFVAYVSFDRVLTIKLYPEQGGEVRMPQMRGGKLFYCCNNHGLFELKI